MKQYEKPTMDLMRLTADDVITLCQNNKGHSGLTIEETRNLELTSN